MRKYIEFGYGNTWWLRTEFEQSDETEYEVKGIAGKIKPISVYLRIWIGQQAYILDLKEGFKKQQKNRRAIKVVFCITSEV